MFGKSEERKGDLRNASVLEVIVAIIIVLVIFIYSNDLDFATQKDAFKEQIRDLAQQVSSLKTEVSDLKRENSKLRKENEDLTRTNEILRDFVDATSNQEGTITDLTDLVRKLQDKVAMLEEQLAAAKRDREKEGKGGIDKPFCRLPVLDQTDRQSYRYIGQVSWSPSGIMFEISPRLIKDDARDIPGISGLENSSPMTPAVFERFAREAFEHSKKQDPECRFFVEVIRDPAVDAPSSFLYLVETFFYKGLRSL